MPLPIETARLEALRKLARERYGEITKDEDSVLLISSSASDEIPPEPKFRPVVNAAFLRWLACDKEAAQHVDPFGIRVKYASISGALNLSFCKPAFRLAFRSCTLRGELNLAGATLTALYLFDCVAEANIKGDSFKTPGDVFFENLKSDHGISIVGAQIGGDLNCEGASLSGKGDVLIADDLRAKGGVFLRNGFSSSGTIRLIGAEIGGDLSCSTAKLTSTGTALEADRARVSGNVHLRSNFSSSGMIRFRSAEIAGDVDLSTATLSATGMAFFLEGARIAGSVMLRKKFSSSGAMSFIGAQIGGDLNCKSAQLRGTGEVMNANSARIRGNVYLRDGFSSSGTIRMLGAEIGGDVSCSGATLSTTEVALYADRVKIAGNLHLRNGFASSGKVRLLGAQIGGDVDCSKAKEIAECDCGKARIGGDLDWWGIGKADQASLRLTSCTVTTLHDERGSWPPKGKLHLQDFVYRNLVLHEQQGSEEVPSPVRLRAEDRIDWLRRQPDDELGNAQPWLQAAKLLESNGLPIAAKRVRFEYRRERARSFNPVQRVGSLLYNLLIREPLWIALIIAIAWAVGSYFFWRADCMHAMAPTIKEARDQFESRQPVPGGYPPFSPVVYALENVLPVVKLGQDIAWAPNHLSPDGSWLPEWPGWMRSSADRSNLTRWFFRLSYSRLALLRWTLIVLGWALALILAAAIGARFKESP